MPKFVVLDSHVVPDADYRVEKKILEDKGIECVVGRCKSEEEILSLAKDADGIGLIYANMNRGLISRLERCQVMVRYGVGYDSIDVQAATDHGICVCNLPDYCQPEVATHAAALLLDLCRKVTVFDRYVRAGNWNENYGYKVHRLSALTLGLVGLGHMSRQFVRYIKPFGMHLLAYDPYAGDETFRENGVEKVTLDQLYARSDVISIHTPLTPETHHLINAESIAKMKDGVMLINTSRGPIVDTDALVDALKRGKVQAAALDVVEGEPIRDPHAKLFECENLIVTPHSAYYSAESGRDQHQKVAYSAIDVLLKKVIPYNCVNRRQLAEKNNARVLNGNRP